MNLAAIGNPQFIALKTFRKNGDGVPTPVWTAAHEDKLYVYTGRDSGKAKRIRRTPRVEVCVSDYRGTTLGEWVEARARVMDEAGSLEKGIRLMISKYGLQFRLLRWVGALRGRRDDSIMIEISASASA